MSVTFTLNGKATTLDADPNHVSGHKGGVAGIYNRSTYAAEKAEALTRWDAHIARLSASDAP